MTTPEVYSCWMLHRFVKVVLLDDQARSDVFCRTYPKQEKNLQLEPSGGVFGCMMSE